MEFVDGELHLFDSQGDVSHVFVKEESRSRASYQYMAKWIVENFDPKLGPDENWDRADKAWNNLSPELKGYLMILSDMEVQSTADIRQGLLATLSGYQGTPIIKALFEDAIKSVRN